MKAHVKRNAILRTGLQNWSYGVAQEESASISQCHHKVTSHMRDANGSATIAALAD
jgi:hypothetical protein